MRIDFCFNQMFKNKKEALRYLESQRRIKNKYNAKSTVRVNKFETSIEFITETGLYFKIYHILFTILTDPRPPETSCQNWICHQID